MAVWGGAARAAPARRREPGSVSRPSAGRVTWRPVPGQVPRAAPRLIPHVAQHRAEMRGGLRHGAVPAPERRSAPAGPAPDGTTRRSTQSPGFPRSASEYAAWPADAAAGSGSDRQDGHSARPPANAATVTGRNGPPRGRVVTRRQSHGTDEAGVCPGNRLTNAGSAPGTRCPASNPSPGEDARSEHTYGGPTGRRCCTFLLYPLFESFELRF